MNFLVWVPKISIKEEKMKAVKNWSKPNLVRDIQIFLSFTNFEKNLLEIL